MGRIIIRRIAEMTEAFCYVYQFRITIDGIRPPIWRRIQVPKTYTFWELNVAIQDAMGWLGGHLYEFTIVNPKMGIDDTISMPEGESDRSVKDGRKKKIAAYFSLKNKKAVYVYDFGDYWEHTVVLEKILPADPKADYPCCIAGKRNGPPDDVGGIPGYEEFVSIMKNPRHKEYDEMVEWYGGTYDPEEFDCTQVVFNDPNALLFMMDGFS